jgi:hypothetical protein
MQKTMGDAFERILQRSAYRRALTCWTLAIGDESHLAVVEEKLGHLSPTFTIAGNSSSGPFRSISDAAGPGRMAFFIGFAAAHAC